MKSSLGNSVRAYVVTIGVGLVLGTLAMVMAVSAGHLIRLVMS